MARKSSLDCLQIPKPCTADWGSMVGNEQKRYCRECNKFVYNLSQMTARQAEALIAASRGHLCARFIRTPDGGILTIPDEPPAGLHLISRRASPVATAVVTAIIGLSGNAAARPAAHNSAAQSTEVKAGRKSIKPEARGLAGYLIGTITDQSHAAIAGATVTLISEGTGEVQTAISSEEGQYRFSVKRGGSYTLKVQAKGLEPEEINGLGLRSNEEKRFNITMRPEVVLMGAMGMAPSPLRELVRDSALIVVGQVGESVKAETEGETTLIKTAVTISSLLKGKEKKSVISVYHWTYDNDNQENPFLPGNNLLLFLDERMSSDGKKRLNGYEVGWQSHNIKNLPEADLAIYQQRIEELIELLDSPTTTTKDIVEWLVRCAEEPATRWEGAYELAQSAESLRYSRESAKEEGRADDQIGAEDQSTNSIDVGYGESLRNAAINLLTAEQKERLAKALFSTDELKEGDIELIKLVSHFKDERLLPFLLSHLRRVEDNPPYYAQETVTILADLLEDQEVSKLAEEYSENASYEDLEAEEASTEAEEVEREAAEETEEAEEPGEVKLAPDEARRRRSEMFKRFLDLVEKKIKQPEGNVNTTSKSSNEPERIS